jgi:lysozyme
MKTWFAFASLSLVFGCSSGSENTCAQGSQALTVCAGQNTVKGLDVSYYDGTIDWTKVKVGHGFAIARVSDGTGFKDPKFAANWMGMKSVGLVRGVYQFFRASQDPIAQADLLLTTVAQLGSDPTDMPPVADVEVLDGQSASTLRANLQKWLDHVEAKIGRKPIIYTGPSFGTSNLGNSFNAYPLWVANWGVTCPSMPSNWAGWKFWQTSATGTVSGISGMNNVDLDTWNGTLQDLIDWTNPGQPPMDGGVDGSSPPPPAMDSGSSPPPSGTTPNNPATPPKDPCAP